MQLHRRKENAVRMLELWSRTIVMVRDYLFDEWGSEEGKWVINRTSVHSFLTAYLRVLRKDAPKIPTSEEVVAARCEKPTDRETQLDDVDKQPYNCLLSEFYVCSFISGDIEKRPKSIEGQVLFLFFFFLRVSFKFNKSYMSRSGHQVQTGMCLASCASQACEGQLRPHKKFVQG